MVPCSPRPVFTAELQPPRPLSKRAVRWMLALCAGALCIVGAGFSLIGAWPVAGFFGVDLLLLYLAFRASDRAARARELISLTPARLTVVRISPRGREQVFEFQPFWLQVIFETAPRRPATVLLRSHGRSLTIGAFLSPGEKQALADRLRGALRTLRPC